MGIDGKKHEPGAAIQHRAQGVHARMRQNTPQFATHLLPPVAEPVSMQPFHPWPNSFSKPIEPLPLESPVHDPELHMGPRKTRPLL